MLNKIIFLSVVTIFVSSTASAKPEYQAEKVPTATERTALGMVRHPGFDGKSLEIVTDGRRTHELIRSLEANPYFRAWMSNNSLTIDSFTWLQIRELDIGKGNYGNRPGGAWIVIPIGFGIRYQTSAVAQGTVQLAL